MVGARLPESVPFQLFKINIGKWKHMTKSETAKLRQAYSKPVVVAGPKLSVITAFVGSGVQPG